MSPNPQNETVRRAFWLKRFGVTAIILFVCTILTWCLWAWYADKQLTRQLDLIRQAGEPITVQDLHKPSLDDSLNAAIQYVQGAATISKQFEVPCTSSLDYGPGLPYPAKWHRMMQKAYPANRQALEVARKTRGLAQWNWNFSLTSPLGKANPGHLSNMRFYANAIADTALHLHFQGNDAEALECVSDILQLGKVIADRPLMIDSLVGIGIDNLALDRVNMIVADAVLPAPGKTPLNRENARKLIDQLLDESEVLQQTRASLQGERVYMKEMNDSLHSHLALLRPALKLDLVQTFQILGHTHPELRSIADTPIQAGDPPSHQWTHQYVRLLSNAFEWTIARYLEKVRESCMERRLMATALAIAAYRVEHGGYPERLDDLVPLYLPAIPVDLTAKNRSQISYRLAEDGKRPVLICAGKDGIIQDTDKTRFRQRPMYGVQSILKDDPSDDQYRDLSAWKDPEVKSVPETDENNTEKPDTPEQ